MAPRSRRKRSSRPGKLGSDLPLPLDVLSDILLDFSAKELCRLRLVCRSWRSQLSDERFIAAHAARHPGPLIVVGYKKKRFKDCYLPSSVLCDIMDLSGRVLKRIRSTGDGIRNDFMLSSHADLVCVANYKKTSSCRLLNPVTGAVYVIPVVMAHEHMVHRQEYFCPNSVVYGQVSATGEHKVLRILRSISTHDDPRQLCEVLTLGSSHARWRGKKAPPNRLAIWKNVVLGSIVYFSLHEPVEDQDAAPDYVASFDLETEEWRPTLRGPVSSLMDGVASNFVRDCFSLAALSGCLVMVDRSLVFSMGLWFLMDFEKRLWVKQHSIQINVQHSIQINVQWTRYSGGPLCVLDDGRIVLFFKGERGLIKIYDPKEQHIHRYGRDKAL